MKRRDFLRAATLAAAAGCVRPLVAENAPDGRRRPNVVFILADQGRGASAGGGVGPAGLPSRLRRQVAPRRPRTLELHPAPAPPRLPVLAGGRVDARLHTLAPLQRRR